MSPHKTDLTVKIPTSAATAHETSDITFDCPREVVDTPLCEEAPGYDECDGAPIRKLTERLEKVAGRLTEDSIAFYRSFAGLHFLEGERFDTRLNFDFLALPVPSDPATYTADPHSLVYLRDLLNIIIALMYEVQNGSQFSRQFNAQVTGAENCQKLLEIVVQRAAIPQPNYQPPTKQSMRLHTQAVTQNHRPTLKNGNTSLNSLFRMMEAHALIKHLSNVMGEIHHLARHLKYF